MEDIEKRREPLPLAAVYFISPTTSSVQHLVADFESKPLYPSVHVFFSSGVTTEAVDKIKRCRVRGGDKGQMWDTVARAAPAGGHCGCAVCWTAASVAAA